MAKSSKKLRFNNVVSLHAGSIDIPILVKVSRKYLYICPLCFQTFQHSRTWKQHIKTQHPTYFKSIESFMMQALQQSISPSPQKQKERPCIKRLRLLIGNNEEIQLFVWSDQKKKYVFYGHANRDEFLEFLNENIDCNTLQLVTQLEKGTDGFYYEIKRKKPRKRLRYYQTPGASTIFALNPTVTNMLINNGIIQ